MDSLHPRMHLIALFSCGFSATLEAGEVLPSRRKTCFEAKEKEKRIGEGKYKLDYEAFFRFLWILKRRKYGCNCLTEIDRFYGFSLKPRWKSVILYCPIPIPFDQDRSMIDLYYFSRHSIALFLYKDRSVLCLLFGYDYITIRLDYDYFVWWWLFLFHSWNVYNKPVLLASPSLVCSTWLIIANLYYFTISKFFLTPRFH